MTKLRPRLSVVLPTFNAERYIAETLETVVSQSFEEWEVVVVDGGSTDNTLEVIRSFFLPNIRVVSEPDEGVAHALDKGVERAQGEFITFLCASDGYLDNDWFRTCVTIMDEDPEVSLVWGIPMIVNNERVIQGVPAEYGLLITGDSSRQFSKMGWFWYWLQWGICFPDGNMVVRKDVYQQCTPRYRVGSKAPDLLMPFYFRFNRDGYLPQFVPVRANYGRLHLDKATYRVAAERYLTIADYVRQVRRYRLDLCHGRYQHVFRDGKGLPIAVVPLLTDPSMADIRERLLSIRYEEDPTHWSREHVPKTSGVK